jgi:hypothetical protein
VAVVVRRFVTAREGFKPSPTKIGNGVAVAAAVALSFVTVIAGNGGGFERRNRRPAADSTFPAAALSRLQV